jgi:hypothetical protein
MEPLQPIGRFATADQARRFAEAHAGLSRGPFRWLQDDNFWVMHVDDEDYIVWQSSD